MTVLKQFRMLCITVFVGLFSVTLGFAQEETVRVPDVTGLSVPAAAAHLNRNGLALGTQLAQDWTSGAGVEPNTVGAQSILPGESVALGTAIDLTILHAPNVLLIYDDNDLTLVNQSSADLDLTGITFTSIGGASPAAFAATRWASSLRNNRCGQVWSITRNGPKGQPECEFVQNWLSTNNPAEHFWTGSNGARQFSIHQNGIERAVCDVSTNGRCGFYIPTETEDIVTPFIYFAYTNDALAIINRSDDQWMPLSRTTIYNNNPNLSASDLPLPVGSPTIFGNPETVADISRLAPGQCLLFTNSTPGTDEPPQTCDVIARLDIGTDLIFWAADFDFDSVTDGKRRTCPAAVDGKITVCLMPR